MSVETVSIIHESLPILFSLAGLMIGAVRLIPQKHYRLAVLESTGGKDGKAFVTKSKQVIVPDQTTAAVAVEERNGGVFTVIKVRDISTNNPETSKSFLQGLGGDTVATLTPKDPLRQLPFFKLTAKYISSKR